VSLLRDFIELITTQPGALVYQLVTLFAIQLIAGVAVGHWQRERDEIATRLLVTGAGILLGRFALMVIAVLHSVGLVSSAVVAPPLERFLQLVTSLLVIWSFLPALEDSPRLAGILILVITLLAVGTYAAFASLWPPAEARGVAYNSFWQATVWDLSTALILSLSLGATLLWRGADWGWLFCLLALWLAGYVLQLGSSSLDSHYAGWVRLANLAALPLLAGLVYRRALRAVTLSGWESTDSTGGAWGVLEAIRLINKETILEPGLELAAASAARILKADVVAIGLVSAGSSQELRVLALHPPTGAVRAGKDLIFPVSDYAVLTRAVEGHAVRSGATRGDQSQAIHSLYKNLGIEHAGPLLVQPLIHQNETKGVILVGNPQSQRHWTSQDRERLETVALALAPTICVPTRPRAESTQ